jgi:ATP-dependent DNA helicase RecQ
VRLSGDSVASHQLVIDDNALQQRKQLELQKIRRMVGYANTRQCRRQRVLAYFGERWDKPNCGSCDNCLDDGAFGKSVQPPKRFPSETEWVTIQKILSCVARMQGRFGRAKVVQVLLGSQASDIVNSYLSRLSTYGILKGASRSMLDVYLDALIEAECIRIVGDEFPKLDLTPLGQTVMRRQQRVLLALPGLTASAASQPSAATMSSRQPSSTASAIATAVPSLTPEVVYPPAVAAHASAVVAPRFTEPAAASATSQMPEPPCDNALFEQLRAQRTVLARAESLPPYCVFNDRTLREMATHRPTTPAGLLRIYGVGATKASKYGETFLALIRSHLAGEAGARD